MDHLKEAKYHLERAISTEYLPDVQALCGVGHALVALVELLEQPHADAEVARSISEHLKELAGE